MGKKQRSAKASLLGIAVELPWAMLGPRWVRDDGSFKSEQFTSEQQAAAYCAPCFKAGPRHLNRAP